MTTLVTRLGRTSLLRGVSPVALETLAASAQRAVVAAGRPVFVEGERGDRCYVVESGHVKITHLRHDGRESTIALLGPQDLFGEMSLFDEAPRSATALALDRCELVVLQAADVRAAMLRHPEIALATLKVLSRRLRATSQRALVASAPVSQRVALALSNLASSHGCAVPDGTRIDARLTQADLAAIVGASREAVSRAVSDLLRCEVVVMDGRRWVVHDENALRRRAQQ